MLTADQKSQLLHDLEDPSFKKEFYRRFLRVPDWKSVWDKLNAGAFKSLSEECRNEMSIEQLFYCANRHAANIHGAYVSRKTGPRPLKPTTLYVWVIYWLYRDGRRDIPLYVGMTRQLSERWTAHKNGSSETSQIGDLATLRITVVETVCGCEKDARIAERKHIAAALLMNPNLFNKAAT